MIRLLLVEDSAVQREFISFVLEESGEFDIVGTAVDGEDGVEQASKLKPDVILMDCQMPKLDGVAATRVIMETNPTPIVLMTASPVESEFTFDAIKNGALAVASKPPAFGTPAFDRVAGQLVRTVRLMSEVKVVRRWPARPRLQPPGAPAAKPPAAAASTATAHVVALVGSTGAPAVIAEILTAVGPKSPATFLIVQHMSEGFITGFASWLTTRTGIPVEVAQHGTVTQAGHGYIAPDGTHMGIDADGRIVLSNDPDDDGFRPSGNYLLKSVARAFGRRAMGVLLTGMGRDGAAGLLELQQAGGLTVAQSEDTCVVFGMPGEAVRLGAAANVLPPDEIARFITANT